MGFNIGSFGKIFNTVTSSLGSLSTNITGLLGKTGTGEEATRTAPFTQPFNNSGRNDSTLRNLALNFNPARATGQDKKLQAYKVEIPLAEGNQKASYEQLTRRVMRTALEVNGIKPTMRELEEMLSQVDNGYPIDFAPKSADPSKARATMATPQQIGTKANGEKVMGYSITLDSDFQHAVINNHKAAKAALAGKPEEKAVIDMNLSERMGEAIKIAYEKGYISKEVREQLGNLTPTELTLAVGMGGAAAQLAKTKAGAAIAAPAGATMLAMAMIKNGAELEVFGKACAKATTRAELDKPAQEFGKWMGALSKEGALAAAGAAGAKVATSVMPKATAIAEEFLTTSIKGAKAAMRSAEDALLPELVTPEGVTIKTPSTQGKTPLEKMSDPLEMRGQGGYESNEVTTSGGTKMPRVKQPHEVEPSVKANEANTPLGEAERIKTNADARQVRGITRQNEAAETLAKNGYAVEQKPQITETDRMSQPWLNKNKNPDFKIEGEIFDAYAPDKLTNADGIRRNIQSKVQQGQTRRIVLNMDDNSVSLSDLKKLLWQEPVVELQQILVVKDGKVIKFFPFKN